jgi:hypothetical protein
VTHRESFEELNFWIDDISKNLGPDHGLIFAIVGNKIDLAS